MEQEFLDWYKANEKRFAHGQFDEKQIAYSAWLEGKRQTKNKNLNKNPYDLNKIDGFKK